MKNKLILSIITVLISGAVFSQSVKLADKYYRKFSYPKAIKVYKHLYFKGDKSAYVTDRIASSYFKNTQTLKAEKWYATLFNKHRKSMSKQALFNYAQSLKANNKYAEADKIFSSKDLENFKGDTATTNSLLTEDKYADNPYSIKNLAAINTPYSDFGGFVYDGTFYFSSVDPNEADNEETNYQWNEQPYLNIYKSSYDASNGKSEFPVISKRQAFSASINKKFHESNAIMTKDGSRIYFTRINAIDGETVVTDRKNIINLKLYTSEFNGKTWGKIKELPFNSDQYNVGHPALSPDEKTLYFISDMPGSLGKTDIYKVAITSKGYGKPVNLGKTINTSEKEMFPYISKDGKLFFSSDGHPGLGLLDIFVAANNGTSGFSAPENLASPFNSSKDDFAMYTTDAMNTGFFSSNRDGGKGDDDIYAFSNGVVSSTIPTNNNKTIKKKNGCTTLLKGLVTDKNTNDPLVNAIVQLTDSEGNLVKQVVSDAKGLYSVNVDCNKKYTVFGTKSFYDSDIKSVSVSKGDPIDLNLSLTPMGVQGKFARVDNSRDLVHPIYFNYDKSNIRQDSKQDLEHLVSLMKKYPSILIEIESHTDSRGSELYNLKLSNRRVKSTKEFIISRGISSSRIMKAVGYGEQQLLNDCISSRADKCSEEQHQFNRRSYFRIVAGQENVTVDNKAPVVIDRKPGK